MNGGFPMNIKKIGKLLVTGILVGALAVTAGCGGKDKSANQAGDGGKKGYNRCSHQLLCAL